MSVPDMGVAVMLESGECLMVNGVNCGVDGYD